MADVFSSPDFAGSFFGQTPDAGGWTSQDTFPRAVANLFGTGPDIVGFGSDGVFVANGDSNGNFQDPHLALPGFFGTSASAGGWTSQNITPRELGQVVQPFNPGTGMGIAGFGQDGVYISPAVADMQGFFDPPTLAISQFGASAAAGGWTSQDSYPRFLANVFTPISKQSAALDDIVGFGSDGVYVSQNLGNGTFASPTKVLSAFGQSQSAGGWTSEDAFPRELADVNGDGLADIVGFGSDGVYVSLNQGNGTFADPTKVMSAFGQSQSWTSQNSFPRELADINGDGRADIVGFGADGVEYALGQANGKFGPVKSDLSNFGTSATAGSWISQDTYPRLLADINGDNKADILGFGSSGVFVSSSSAA
jgi:hypothetical protein